MEQNLAKMCIKGRYYWRMNLLSDGTYEIEKPPRLRRFTNGVHPGSFENLKYMDFSALELGSELQIRTSGEMRVNKKPLSVRKVASIYLNTLYSVLNTIYDPKSSNNTFSFGTPRS